MPRVQVLTEVQGRAQEVMLTEHVPSECSPTSITLTSSSSAWAGRSSTPSTMSRSRRSAPDRAASRGEAHLKAVSGFVRAVEPVPVWHHARHGQAHGA